MPIFSPNLSNKTLIGCVAGIASGVTYGLNPLFAVPLMKNGATVEAILFFRYTFAVLILGGFLLCRNMSFRITPKQSFMLLLAGGFYATSSIGLFEAYNYIPSGLATTLIFLYPVIVALIMVFLKVFPSWQMWLSILATFVGVALTTRSGPGQTIAPFGIFLCILSGAAYAFVVVILNRSIALSTLNNTIITFYSLVVGTCIFATKIFFSDAAITAGLNNGTAWINLVALAILPTIVSIATLAVATRYVGPTTASVLGVFEPITAILVGTICFSEPLTFNMAAGIIIAISAVTFMISCTKK